MTPPDHLFTRNILIKQDSKGSLHFCDVASCLFDVFKRCYPTRCSRSFLHTNIFLKLPWIVEFISLNRCRKWKPKAGICDSIRETWSMPSFLTSTDQSQVLISLYLEGAFCVEHCADYIMKPSNYPLLGTHFLVNTSYRNRCVRTGNGSRILRDRGGKNE